MEFRISAPFAWSEESGRSGRAAAKRAADIGVETEDMVHVDGALASISGLQWQSRMGYDAGIAHYIFAFGTRPRV